MRPFCPAMRPAAPGATGGRWPSSAAAPAGMAAAFFLGRAGIPVTLFERTDALGGIVRQVIPAWRISDEAIDKDVALMEKMGVEVKLNTEAPSVTELKATGYTHIFFAVGAWKAGKLDIPGNVVPVIGWLKDLKAGKEVPLGHVAVVGGGNTAMDAARAALRCRRQVLHPGLPPDQEVYARRRRGAGAGHGRRRAVPGAGGSRGAERTASWCARRWSWASPTRRAAASPYPPARRWISIAATPSSPPWASRWTASSSPQNGIAVDAKGIPDFKTNVDGVYVGGDAMRGPATVVEGIADAQAFANAVIGEAHPVAIPAKRRVHPCGGHCQEGHPLRERQVRGRPVPDLQRGVRGAAPTCAPTGPMWSIATARRPPSDPPRGPDVQRVRQLRRLLPLRLRPLPGQVHPVPRPGPALTRASTTPASCLWAAVRCWSGWRARCLRRTWTAANDLPAGIEVSDPDRAEQIRLPPGLSPGCKKRETEVRSPVFLSGFLQRTGHRPLPGQKPALLVACRPGQRLPPGHSRTPPCRGCGCRR